MASLEWNLVSFCGGKACRCLQPNTRELVNMGSTDHWGLKVNGKAFWSEIVGNGFSEFLRFAVFVEAFAHGIAV